MDSERFLINMEKASQNIYLFWVEQIQGHWAFFKLSYPLFLYPASYTLDGILVQEP